MCRVTLVGGQHLQWMERLLLSASQPQPGSAPWWFQTPGHRLQHASYEPQQASSWTRCMSSHRSGLS